MAIRLKDIAKDLGVSTVTVSKVLRGNTDISESTRSRVLKRMRELDYRPNMLARGLASGRSFTVGLIVPDLVHPFFAEVAKYLGAVLRQNNLALLLASSEETPEIEAQEIRALLSRGVDVLVLASCQAKHRPLLELASGPTPYLLIDRNYPQLGANFVGSDDYRIGQLATRHLIETGRRRIAHIGGRDLSPSVERLRGYRETLAEHGIRVPEKYFKPLDRFEEIGDLAGYHAMRELLTLKQRPDAVFCYNDLSAIGAMTAAREAGLRIPQEIAFVGCGNLRYARHLRKPLTSIDQSTQQLGERAGEIVLQLIKDAAVKRRNVLIEPALVVRQSSGGTRG